MTESERLIKLVDDFASAMKDKLLLKMSNNWDGWDDSYSDFGPAQIVKRIHKQTTPGKIIDPVDLANYAAFLWHSRRKTS